VVARKDSNTPIFWPHPVSFDMQIRSGYLIKHLFSRIAFFTRRRE
jgi:hypothetical protein